jgi:hypothetical protein
LDKFKPSFCLLQRLLAGRVSNAAQVALHDVTDPGSSLRAWLNNPLATSLQEDIFKATSTLRSFDQIGRLKPEKGIPDWVLSGAKGAHDIDLCSAN